MIQKHKWWWSENISTKIKCKVIHKYCAWALSTQILYILFYGFFSSTNVSDSQISLFPTKILDIFCCWESNVLWNGPLFRQKKKSLLSGFIYTNKSKCDSESLQNCIRFSQTLWKLSNQFLAQSVPEITDAFLKTKSHQIMTLCSLLLFTAFPSSVLCRKYLIALF